MSNGPKWKFTPPTGEPGWVIAETPFQAARRHAVDAVIGTFGKDATAGEIVNAVLTSIDFVTLIAQLDAAETRATTSERQLCGWRTIDTAPRDYSWFIATQKNFAGQWMAPTAVKWAGTHWTTSNEGSTRMYHQPTHWQPSPAPPDE